MAHLAGKFAGILRVEVPDEKAKSVLAALTDLEGRGLRVLGEASSGAGEVPPGRTLALELVGLDRPGLVREVSQDRKSVV